MNRDIEDGMGFSGLVESKAERRERICQEHDAVETTLVMQAAADSLKQLRESGASGGRFVKTGGDVFFVVVRFDRKNAVGLPRLSRERLIELREKVQFGFNLRPDEARELLAHYGEPIANPRKRCRICDGDAGLRCCEFCHGEGYEVVT